MCLEEVGRREGGKAGREAHRKCYKVQVAEQGGVGAGQVVGSVRRGKKTHLHAGCLQQTTTVLSFSFSSSFLCSSSPHPLSAHVQSPKPQVCSVCSIKCLSPQQQSGGRDRMLSCQLLRLERRRRRSEKEQEKVRKCCKR